MQVLYIGDIMGAPGVRVIEQVLPDLKRKKHIDLVVAQAENVSEGKGITPKDFRHLCSLGIDFFTGGNWTLYRPEINQLLEDPKAPIIRPANYPVGTPGKGYKYIDTPFGSILVISLLGQVVGRDAERSIDNPLTVIDSILENEKSTTKIATIVNFHGDYSSEKRVIGYYLDGRVDAVVGDHWHVPTADAIILPKGTAHVTDVGMCGSLDSSLGIELDIIIRRWRHNAFGRNILETSGRMQFNAVLIGVKDAPHYKTTIERIQILL